MLKNKLKQISLLQQWSPTLLAPETSFVEDNFSTDGGGRPRGGDGSGGNASDGERQMKLCSSSPLLTSCCVARFLTAAERYQSAPRGLETPALQDFSGPLKCHHALRVLRGGYGSQNVFSPRDYLLWNILWQTLK